MKLNSDETLKRERRLQNYLRDLNKSTRTQKLSDVAMIKIINEFYLVVQEQVSSSRATVAVYKYTNTVNN